MALLDIRKDGSCGAAKKILAEDKVWNFRITIDTCSSVGEEEEGANQ